MIRLKLGDTLHGLLKDNTFKAELSAVVRESQDITLGFYKKETPVDKGTLRGSVAVVSAGGLDYVISARAKNRGFLYGIAVHSGTGIFKDTATDYPSKGRIRRGETRPGIGGIRPNMFAKRASEKSMKPLYNFIYARISKIIE